MQGAVHCKAACAMQGAVHCKAACAMQGAVHCKAACAIKEPGIAGQHALQGSVCSAGSLLYIARQRVQCRELVVHCKAACVMQGIVGQSVDKGVAHARAPARRECA